MKIYLKLPGGGELHFEKAPMSKDALESLGWWGMGIGYFLFILILMWILR